MVFGEIRAIAGLLASEILGINHVNRQLDVSSHRGKTAQIVLRCLTIVALPTLFKVNPNRFRQFAGRNTGQSSEKHVQRRLVARLPRAQENLSRGIFELPQWSTCIGTTERAHARQVVRNAPLYT